MQHSVNNNLCNALPVSELKLKAYLPSMTRICRAICALAVSGAKQTTRYHLMHEFIKGALSSNFAELLACLRHCCPAQTPNLGQGGCTALEDGVVLGRQLAPLLKTTSSSSSSSFDAAAVAAVLRRCEEERAARCLPLTVRSWAFGAALQLPFPPVLAARDFVMEKLFSPSHFLDHTQYDCGRLPA
jgi:hypothetical protein